MAKHPCPMCGRQLEKSGEVVDPDRGPSDVFQCDHCVVKVPMFGESWDVALTFAVDRAGVAYDPATADGEAPPWGRPDVG